MPTILRPQVRIPITTSTLRFFQFEFGLKCEKDENKRKEATIGPHLKKPGRPISVCEAKEAKQFQNYEFRLNLSETRRPQQQQQKGYAEPISVSGKYRRKKSLLLSML